MENLQSRFIVTFFQKWMPLRLNANHAGLELNLLSNSVNWLDVYKSNYSATPETKLKSFYVKLNLRAIVTNIALHCFDIADSDKCSFCKTERETLLHLFCTCSSLVLFWESVISWIETKLKLQLNLQPFNLFLVLKKLTTTV